MQSINRYFTEYEVWHPTHHGGCSCLCRYEWLMCVCPIRRWDRTISSLWDFLDPSFHSPISAFIVWSLLCGVLFHLNCHLFWVKFFILIFKSVYRILQHLSMGIFQAVLAAESAWSFPLIPVWLGIQHSSISLVFDRISSLFKGCMVRGLPRFWFFREFRTDKGVRKKMMNLVDYVCVIIYGLSFGTVDRSAARKSFCYLGIMLDGSTWYFVSIFGTICRNTEMVWAVIFKVKEFFKEDSRVGVFFMIFC